MISPTERLRTSPILAVRQKEHPIAQPTWLETQSVFLPSFGIQTDSIVAPSFNLNAILAAPSGDV